MRSETISVRVDSETKLNAELLFEELGISLSAAINIFLKQAVRNQQIPFTPSLQKKNNDFRSENAQKNNQSTKKL